MKYAQYTETLSEWLEHNELPQLFNAIPAYGWISFAQVFTAKYALREIAGETEERFAYMLNARAAEVIPFYAAKIGIENELQGVNPLNVERGGTTTTTEYGAPNGIVANGETGRSVTEIKDAGAVNASEIVTIAAAFAALPNLYTELLEKFEVCFMGVY